MILARAITSNESAVLLALCGIVSILLRVQYKQRKASHMITRSPTRPRDRRRLGRGQYPQQAPVTTTVTGAVNSATISFSQPVVVSGPAPLVVESRTFVSQQLTNPTTLVVLTNGTVAGMDWTLSQDNSVLRGEKGQSVSANAGTF